MGFKLTYIMSKYKFQVLCTVDHKTIHKYMFTKMSYIGILLIDWFP